VDRDRVADDLARAEADLDGVDGALRRLDDGTYGRCEVCGGEIDDARLAASPTTTTCAEHGGA
jgi:DnaK suppressor protein